MPARTTLSDGKFYLLDLVTGEVLVDEYSTPQEAAAAAADCNIDGDLAVGEAYKATGRDGRPCMKLRPVTA